VRIEGNLKKEKGLLEKMFTKEELRKGIDLNIISRFFFYFQQVARIMSRSDNAFR